MLPLKLNCVLCNRQEEVKIRSVLFLIQPSPSYSLENKIVLLIFMSTFVLKFFNLVIYLHFVEVVFRKQLKFSIFFSIVCRTI
jgi:hypothetical protein